MQQLNKFKHYKISSYYLVFWGFAVVAGLIALVSFGNLFIFLSVILIGICLQLKYYYQDEVYFFHIVLLYGLMTTIVAPILIYLFFNEDFEPSLIWDRFMVISWRDYFIVMAPLYYLFYLLIIYVLKLLSKFKIKKRELSDKKFLIVTISAIMVHSITSVLYVPIFSAFAGSFLFLPATLFVFRSIDRFKIDLPVMIYLIYLLYKMLTTGMFTDLIIVIIALTYVFLKSVDFTISRKIFVLSIFTCFFFFLQMVKINYRSLIWSGEVGRGNISAFSQSIENSMNLSGDDSYMIFNLVQRLNVGRKAGEALLNVPKTVDYTYGFPIVKGVMASLVPRMLWKDKPKTGGWFNVSYYLGDNDSILTGHSYNIGLLADAYVNFGFLSILFFVLVAAFLYIILKLIVVVFKCNLIINFIGLNLMMIFEQDFTSFFLIIITTSVTFIFAKLIFKF